MLRQKSSTNHHSIARIRVYNMIMQCTANKYNRLTVTLLSASTSALAAELLGLHAPRVCDQQCSIIRYQLLLELHRAKSIDVFCVVCHKCFGNSLADSIDLGSVPSTFYADADIKDREGVFSGNKNGLVDLET